MSIDPAALFQEGWDHYYEERRKQSPSFDIADYTVTGRASAKYGGRKNHDWWADNGPRMVQNYVDWMLKNQWTIWTTPEGQPGVELGLNFVLPGDIMVKAFVDLMMVTPVGELVVVDAKTGRLPESGEQLGLYATGVQLIHGVRPQWGFYWDADKGVHSQPYNLDRWTPEFLAAMYEEDIAGINAGSFPAKPANGCHNWCGFSNVCATVGGADALGVDPLLDHLT